jgi:tRNA modification GTPase
MFESSSDTIAAISTKPGEAAIGIVKISGEKSIEIADRIFKSEKNRKISDMKTYNMVYGSIIDNKENVVDAVIVTLMKKPKSYTREDVVEINCHGGLIATEKVLELCLENGARIAEPGEFTKRAFLNGRIDLSQAEAVMEIVKSKTEESLKIAARNIKGETRNEIEKLRKIIMDVMVELEASIDFIEEDLEITPYSELEKKVNSICGNIATLIKDEEKGEIIKNGVKIAIVGKTNVGKSSLLNILSKKEKAIVTALPGTTRDAVEEVLYLEGIPLMLVDTAGIRKAKNMIEKIGVKKSLGHISEAEIVILVLDGNRKVENEDKEIMEKIKEKETIACINKIDLEQKIERNIINKRLGRRKIIEISALVGTGINKLEKEIKRTVLGDINYNIENKIIVNARHKKILKEVKKILEDSKKAMKDKMSEEFPSSDLKNAYDLLGEIVGEKTGEELLNKIFSKFCIGK